MIGLEHIERLWSSLAALGARRLIALGIVGVTVFTAVGLGSYYLSRPDLETLYGGLSPQEVSRIGAVLSEAGITFDVNSEGTKVMVPYGQTSHARMLLAEKGLPSSASAGYELFDKLGPVGLTSFMQEVTRVRALEGEIARTIQAMKGVRAARVHIVLSDAGSFRRNRQPPSASVVIRTDTPGDVSSAQAIRHLVAAAVPGMSIDQVRVLGTDGTILAAGGDSVGAIPAKMVDLEKTISRELQENVRKTLAPYLGLENFEISVAARLNMDKRQISETNFDPESKVERSLRVIKETGSSQNVSSKAAVGVEQNVPAEQTDTQGGGDQSKRANERREELTNFELNTKTVSTVSEGYKIENLTIAVVLNRKQVLASLGEAASPDAMERQLKEIERLVGSAAGIDTKRGDRVTVAAVDFFQNGQGLEPVASGGIGEQLVRQTGSFVKAATVLAVTFLLIWFGLRPATRVLLEVPKTVPIAGGALPGAPMMAAALPGAPQIATDVEPEGVKGPQVRLDNTPQKRLEQLVELDEEHAAAILKQWMRGAKAE